MSKISMIINSLLPVKKGVVLFDAFGGQYTDNPKAVSKYLHEIAPDISIVWVKSDKSKEQFPKYVKTVERGSSEYYKFVCRAQVVVDNHAGLRVSYEDGKGLKGKIKSLFV